MAPAGPPPAVRPVPDALDPEAARCLAMARLRLARKCPGKSSSALVKPGTEAAYPLFLNRCIAASKLASTGPAVRG